MAPRPPFPRDPDEIAVKKRLFLRHLRDGHSWIDVCAMLKMDRYRLYTWRKRDANFARQFAECQDAAIDYLEELVHARALSGSDSLAMFILKSKRPEIYGQKQELSIKGQVTHDYAQLSLDEIKVRLAQLRAETPALDAPTIEGSVDPEPAPNVYPFPSPEC